MWPGDERPRNRLSPRERELLMWVCRGKTHAEAALILGLSLGTTKRNLDVARYKLNAVNLAQACALAVVHRVLSHDEIREGARHDEEVSHG